MSALRTLDEAALAAAGLRLMLSLNARDPAQGAHVCASHAYGPADTALDMRCVDAVVGRGENHSVADMRKISGTEPNP